MQVILILYAFYFVTYLIIYPQSDLFGKIVGIVIPSLGAIMADAKVLMGFTHMVTLMRPLKKKN